MRALEKFYFQTEKETGVCVEKCNVKPNTMIGSTKCKECAFNQHYNEKPNYIICSKIKQATTQ